MPVYMVQFSYTTEAWQKLMHTPEDRSAPLIAAAEKLGGKVLGLYYCFGDYDGCVMVEVPDDVAAGALVLAASGAGHLKSTKTTRLYSVQEAMQMMGQAGSLAYPAPKG